MIIGKMQQWFYKVLIFQVMMCQSCLHDILFVTCTSIYQQFLIEFQYYFLQMILNSISYTSYWTCIHKGTWILFLSKRQLRMEATRRLNLEDQSQKRTPPSSYLSFQMVPIRGRSLIITRGLLISGKLSAGILWPPLWKGFYDPISEGAWIMWPPLSEGSRF